MDFEKVIGLLINDFEKDKINYALIGGFAIGVLGVMRSTMDLEVFREKLDWGLIDEYFLLFGREDSYRSLKDKYGTAK